MVGATGFEPDMAQVKVTFTTSEDGYQLPETKSQLLVPAGTPTHTHIHPVVTLYFATRPPCTWGGIR